MRTKEFIKRIEELGFEAWISGRIAYVLKDGRYEVARIKTKRACAIDFFYLLNETLDKEISEKLFDLVVEYAKTPIEDREEECAMTSFFKQKIEEWGFQAMDSGENYLVANMDGNLIAIISKNVRKQINTDFVAWDELSDEKKDMLFDLFIRFTCR